jgi:hypothetical protein
MKDFAVTEKIGKLSFSALSVPLREINHGPIPAFAGWLVLLIAPKRKEWKKSEEKC